MCLGQEYIVVTPVLFVCFVALRPKSTAMVRLVTPVRLEPANPRSQVKHSTTEPP